MTTDTREVLAAAKSALGQLIEAGKAVKAALDANIPDGDPVHPESRRLTWPISSGLLALDAVDAALATQPAQPSAQGEAVAPAEATDAMVKAAAKAALVEIEEWFEKRESVAGDLGALDEQLEMAGLAGRVAGIRAALATQPVQPKELKRTWGTPFEDKPL